MSIEKNKTEKISNCSGVYIFKDSSGRVLYIGKATNLKGRVSSYFNRSRKEGRPVMAILEKVARIETRETESVLEALILEANLIKKHQPPFNVDLKDDKSFSYVVITAEEFPRVLVVRETELGKVRAAKEFGPYTSKKQLETAIKIIRKIFPFHSRQEKSEKGCLEFQIGLCPGPYSQAISKTDYRKNIRNIRMILEGKKKGLLGKLKKEMESLSQAQAFEEAADVRNQIFALEHIRDVALIAKDEKREFPKEKFRIEAYDISNISGQYATGSMAVFENGQPEKKEYRKFRIKTVSGANDVAMLMEVLFRRFRNSWAMPDLVLLDGGKGHINMAEKVFKELKVDVPLVAVAKGPKRKNLKLETLTLDRQARNSKKSLNDKIEKEIQDTLSNKKLIKQIMDEAHRFAITYHKKIRKREFLK